MRLFTAEQMRSADRAAIDAGVASVLLMEAAGRGVADMLRERWPDAGRILVLCGPGNNGGDGYVAARYLRLAGLEVAVLEMSSEPSSEDADRARRAWIGMGGSTPAPLASDALAGWMPHADVVVDALLGSGLSRPLEGSLVDVVRILAGADATVLSVDVPTGVSADSAVPPGEHVHAAATAQLAGPKMSSALEPARGAYGAWRVVDIGIPRRVLDAASDVRLLDGVHAPAPAPARPADAHKYSVGTVLVVAGSERYLGAAELACRGAYRGGAGLVTLAAEARLPSGWPEIVFAPLAWDDDPLAAIERIDPKRVGCLVVGPGLDPRAVPFLPELLRRREAPFVLDAGALAADASLRSAVASHGACLLTPHVGEAAALLHAGTREVLSDPLAAAREIASGWRAVVALKGATTVIARPSGRASVSTTGHPGMATGGTGDVLAGVAGAALSAAAARTPDAVADAAERAVWRHGRAGELAAVRYGAGLTASDVADEVARVA